MDAMITDHWISGLGFRPPLSPARTLMFLACVLVCSRPPVGVAKDKADFARDFREQLSQKVMPYWLETVDPRYGGYLLADDVKGKGTATEKQIVTQSRMIWGFSTAHQRGYSDAQHNYLKAAENGYHFMLDHFLDRQYGGYYWKTDVAGKPLNERKLLYGEAFVVYAFVEYYRASHDKEALRHALDLYHTLQDKCHDREHGGWIEHCERDFRPVPSNDPQPEVEIAGYRSANAHLHWMEALTELYDATRDPGVQQSLGEALRLNATYFYPPIPGKSAFHCHPDWSTVTDARSAGLSYGHNVEFAWLMIRAERVLKQKISWDHFNAIMEHALKYGYDHQRGGLYSRGFDDRPATETEKTWWVQAEMLAALTDGLKHEPRNAAYSEALDRELQWLVAYQINPDDGIWIESANADGTPKGTAKAHSWKAAYHDVRGIVKFIDGFGRR
jgi:mannobiose 2-epimerase